MVRLKDCCSKTFYNKIKVFQFLMVRLKESMLSKVSRQATTFQFLMVRLKGRLSTKIKIKTRISIPYGAIKRIEIHHQPYIHKPHFNSLWCD